MSRSGYTDDYDDQWSMIRWRGAVKAAMRGSRGQAFLRELLADLDAMPEKRLLAVTINTNEGCCTLGCVTRARGIDTSELEEIDPDDYGGGETAESLAHVLGISGAMAREIVWANDEGAWDEETPEQRWTRMREWVAKRIKEKTP